MVPRSLSALVLACSLLVLPASACRRGGGGEPPCPTQTLSRLRPHDGAPSGELRVTTGSDALTVEFRPSDGRPYVGVYLIGLDGESWPIVSDGGSVSVPWDGLADDVCGRSVTAGIASLPDQNLFLTVRCADAAPTEAATSTGGSSGGGSCQP